MIYEPRGAFTCRSSKITILADFDPFREPQAISMVVEPQVALTCRPSTLIVLADSGPFRGLLLTLFGVPE